MKRAKFNLSHYRLASFNLGVLEVVDCMEVLPGDSFRHGISALIRSSPLVAPVMHPVEIQLWQFFVPNRLVWSNWESFIVEPNSGFSVPTVDLVTAGAANSAYGLAVGLGAGKMQGTAGAVPTSRTMNALPFRGYNLIWNQFFRDQDIDAALTVNTGNGPDTPANYALRLASWKKDYFTTARASAQKGSASTMIMNFEDGTNFNLQLERGGSGAGANVIVNQAGGPSGTDIRGYLSIDQWRTAMALQKVKEHRNRFGSRYTDYLAFLGVHADDFRLQRPEYIGGGRQTISFSEVLATANNGSNTVVGDMAGHGIAAIRTRPYKRFFQEHGHVITLMAARPVGIYANQVPRNMFRSSWSDYWQKEEEIRSDQPVLKKELNNAEAVGTSNDVFGYVPRHEEYRRHPSSVGGEMLSTLDDWHFARFWDASTGPVLNTTFLQCLPAERPFAYASEDNLRAMIYHQVAARRLVSKYARN